MSRKTIYMAGVIGSLACFTWAETLAKFDFENHQAGSTLRAPGEVRTRSSVGDGFPFRNNIAAANCSVSPLSASDKNRFDPLGANVRRDTLAAISPGGNFIEISPARLEQPIDEDIEPFKTGDCFLFSVQANDGYFLNISSFSFDVGVARGAKDRGGITLRAHGWYSIDDGKKWMRMSRAYSILNASPESFVGFETISADLSRFINLQKQPGKVLIAIALGDNSNRNPYVIGSEADPAGIYLDNIILDGSVTKTEGDNNAQAPHIIGQEASPDGFLSEQLHVAWSGRKI